MSFQIKFTLAAALCFSAVGCYKDLDTVPLDSTVSTPNVVYKDPASYRQILAKLYAGFAVSGQKGPAGDADISGIDEGFGQYLRGFWYHQELTTDEAVIGWNDQTIKNFHGQNWTSSDGFTYAFYSRVFYQISLANEFLRESTEAKLDSRGADAALKAEVKKYRAEARFLRAISYWHALDIFRNPPFATENDVVGTFVPKQTNARDLYNFLEKELLEIEPDLAEPRTNEYARADKAAAWMLLAKLYLNAQVYIGEAKNNECLAVCEKVLNAGYTLDEHYRNLFLADNQQSKEVIFPIAFDGVHTRTWGGMTFIIRAGIGGSMPPTASGVASGWGGTRTTKEFVGKFPAGNGSGILVNFNIGLTNTYAPLYVPNSTQGFDATKTDNSLTAIGSTKIFEGYRYFPDATTELLFTQYPSNTAPMYGDNGANGSLEIGGAKIVVNGAGLYFIKVNLNAKTYVIEKRDFGIIGSATGGVEIPMQFDTTRKVVYVKTALAAGGFKFRPNHDDALSLGDDGANAILEKNGADIAVSGGGYEISLDIDKLDYTYQIKSTDFDRRPMFYTSGQNLEISDLTLFTEGYAINKFKNVKSTGGGGSDTDFPDTDFPMFRLADAYLMAAEAILRGAGGGDKTRALGYVNVVRSRAFEGLSGNISLAELDLPFILDERARELYWEGHRRTDLIRFGQFTDGTYKWAWKGNVAEGTSVPSYRNIFPIPAADLGANPSLQQNTGY